LISHTGISSPFRHRRSGWRDSYLDVLAVEVGDREVSVEADVFDSIGGLEVGEPFFDGAK